MDFNRIPCSVKEQLAMVSVLEDTRCISLFQTRLLVRFRIALEGIAKEEVSCPMAYLQTNPSKPRRMHPRILQMPTDAQKSIVVLYLANYSFYTSGDLLRLPDMLRLSALCP